MKLTIFMNKVVSISLYEPEFNPNKRCKFFSVCFNTINGFYHIRYNYYNLTDDSVMTSDYDNISNLINNPDSVKNIIFDISSTENNIYEINA